MKTKPPFKFNARDRQIIKPDGTIMPVIDSPHSTVIRPNANDIKQGVRGDPTKCMYALACKRMFESELVWINRGVAYVELTGKGGKPELHRFILKESAKENVKNFDAGKTVYPESVLFAAPSRSQTLDAQAEKEKRRGKAPAYVKGSIKGEPLSGSKGSRKALMPFRDPGTGKFHFHAKAA